MIFKLSVYAALVASSSEPKKNDASTKDLIPKPDSEINTKEARPQSNADLKTKKEEKSKKEEGSEKKVEKKKEGESKKKDEKNKEEGSDKKNQEKKEEEAAEAERAPETKACPHPPKDEDYQKYQCLYKLSSKQNPVPVNLTVGRDAEYVYVKGETEDDRWLGVGVSKEAMKELSVVLNQEDGKKNSGARLQAGFGNPTGEPVPEGDDALEDVSHALKDGKRISSFKFNLKKWEENKNSGISIAFGMDEKEPKIIGKHKPGHVYYIKFDGSDKDHILPDVSSFKTNEKMEGKDEKMEDKDEKMKGKDEKMEDKDEKMKGEDGKKMEGEAKEKMEGKDKDGHKEHPGHKDGDEDEMNPDNGEEAGAKSNASRFCAISPLLLLSA